MLFLITNRCIFLLAKHIVMFWKMHRECSFRASRGVEFPKFPKVAPNHGGCSLTDFRIFQNTFYISIEPRTPSFPIRLVKTESCFIVRSVETGLGRWTLVVPVISVDAYPFLAFSDLTCYLEDTGIGVFWLHCATW